MSHVYMLSSTVALTVVIHAVLYCAVDSLDVLAIRSTGLLGKIVHISYLTFLFSVDLSIRHVYY